MMAAMVLTSLSCSPVVQSPPGAEPIFSGEQAGSRWFLVWQRLTTDALSFQLLMPGHRVLEALRTVGQRLRFLIGAESPWGFVTVTELNTQPR